MANELVPFWDPADHITAVAGTGGVTGKRFVACTGPLAVGLGASGGVPTVVLPAAGAAILGVAAQDAAAGLAVMIQCEGIIPVVVGATPVVGGTQVEVDATGKVIPWGGTIATQPAGYCMADAAVGTDAMIRLR